MIKVKNNTGASKVWVGQTISSGAYYVLETFEIPRWQQNSLVLSDIGASNLVVNDGSNDITDVASAIEYLLGLQSNPNLELRFYKSVSPNTTDTSDYVVANGQTLVVNELGGNGAIIQDTEASIIWDADGTPEILLSTRGDASQSALKILSGNGVKKLRIQLSNQSASSQTMGAYVLGDLS